MFCCSRQTACASGTSCGGTPMRKVCSDSGSVKPGSTARKASNVRIMRPGAHEQHERERDLAHDERVLRAVLPAAGARAARAAQARREPCARRSENRGEAEQRGGDQRHEQSEAERTSVERDLVQARQPLRREREQDLQRAVRDQEPHEPTQQREQDVLDEHRARDAPRARAERGPHVELERAARAAHEQQVRDVGARDQEHDADHRHDDPQHVAHAADDVVLEPPQRRRHAPGVEINLAGRDGAAARKRKPLDPDRQHALDVGIGLLDRHAVAQARDAVAAERRRDQLRTVDAKRRDEIRRDVAELEAPRHDADDLGADGHRPRCACR